jgi:hypothetical protein
MDDHRQPPLGARRRVRLSQHIGGRGTATGRGRAQVVVRVKGPLGFSVTDDWGEGAWTARDLR